MLDSANSIVEVGMRKLLGWTFIAMLFLSFLFLNSCTQDYECDVYIYDGGTWSYYSWDVYSGKDASEAEDNCESDWASSYDCRNCEPY